MTRFIKKISLTQKLAAQIKRLTTVAGLTLISLNVSAYDISINGSEYLSLTETLDSFGTPTTHLMEYDLSSNPATVSFHVSDPLVCASKTNSSAPNIITQVQDGNGIEVTTMQNNIVTTEYDFDNNQFNITTDDTIACATIADAANNVINPPNPDTIYENGFENTSSVANNDIKLTLLKVVDSSTNPMVTEPFPNTPITVSNSQIVEYQYIIENTVLVGSTNLTVDFVEFYSLIASNGPVFNDAQDWTCTVPASSNAATTCGNFAFGSQTVRLDNAVVAPGDSLIIYAKRQALVDAADISNNLKLDMLASAFIVDAGVTDSYLDNNTTYQQFGSSLVTATQLVMTGQPNASVASGNSLGSIIVEFQDGTGLLDANNSSAVTIAIQNNPSAGTLSGTVTKAAINGIATFSDLNIDLAGTGYTLVATGGGFTSSDSNAIDIVPATASQLAVVVQPNDTVAGGIINPIEVELQDLNGNLVNSSAGAVHVSIVPFSGASGAILSGSNDIVMTNGLVTFSNLSIDLVNALNNKYRLRFNYQFFGGNFDSNEFDITAVPVAANSEFGVSVNSETAGTNVTYSALIKDASNNPIGAGIVVNFTMTNTDANTPMVSCTTGVAGTCNVTATSTLIGTTAVAADIGGTNIPNTTVGLFNSTTWIAGEPDASMSNFWFDTATSPTGSSVNAIAEVKDQYGNVVSGVPVTFSLQDAAGAVTPDFPACSTTTSSLGICSAVVSSATTGTTTLTSAAAGFPSVVITNPTPPGGSGRVVTWQ